MGLKFKGVRSMKEGRMLVELADEAERKRMLEDRRLREAGLRVEKPKTFPPLFLIRAVPKGMKDDELLDEVYVRNLKEEVDAEEMERTMRVKFRIRSRSREKEGVVLEVSPRIRQALLGTGSEARLYIRMRLYFVEAFERVSRCFGCYGLNHRAIEYNDAWAWKFCQVKFSTDEGDNLYRSIDGVDFTPVNQCDDDIVEKPWVVYFQFREKDGLDDYEDDDGADASNSQMLPKVKTMLDKNEYLRLRHCTFEKADTKPALEFFRSHYEYGDGNNLKLLFMAFDDIHYKRIEVEPEYMTKEGPSIEKPVLAEVSEEDNFHGQMSYENDNIPTSKESTETGSDENIAKIKKRTPDKTFVNKVVKLWNTDGSLLKKYYQCATQGCKATAKIVQGIDHLVPINKIHLDTCIPHLIDNRGVPTFRSSNGTSNINATFATSGIARKLELWRVEEWGQSDHRPIRIVLNFDATPEPFTEKPRYSMSRADWGTFTKSLLESKTKINSVISSQPMDVDNVEAINETITKTIIASSRRVLW
ncbi:hypothetical protein TKK_0016594 [Trichogramma kaykai]